MLVLCLDSPDTQGRLYLHGRLICWSSNLQRPRVDSACVVGSTTGLVFSNGDLRYVSFMSRFSRPRVDFNFEVVHVKLMSKSNVKTTCISGEMNWTVWSGSYGSIKVENDHGQMRIEM